MVGYNTHTHTHIHTHTYTHIHTHTNTHTHIYTHIHINTHTYTHIHTNAHTQKHTRTLGFYSLWLEFPSYSPIFIPLNLNQKPYRLRNIIYASRLMSLSERLPHEFVDYN